MLFCGLLVNGPALAEHQLQWLQKASFLYYFIEIVLVNELTDINGVLIRPRSEALKKHYHPTPIPGVEILEQLGYTTDRDDRLIDLYIMGAWVVSAQN